MERDCRVCRTPLFTKTEKVMGVHIRCAFGTSDKYPRPKNPGYSYLKQKESEKWPKLE